MKVFVTKFVTHVRNFVIHITNFVTHVSKFVIHVTKFVTTTILYERKNYLADYENYLADSDARNGLLGEGVGKDVCRKVGQLAGKWSVETERLCLKDTNVRIHSTFVPGRHYRA